MAQNTTATIDWTTDNGASVSVHAKNGHLIVSLDGNDVTISDQRAKLDHKRGMDVLDAGVQRDDSGTKFHAYIPVDGRRSQLEELREESEITPTDDPLRYEVVEKTKTLPRLDGWGGGTTTVKRLVASKSHLEMTERQRELHHQVHGKRDIPEDAEVGDIVDVQDILNDPRTRDEKDQDALDEAAETGEDVTISQSTTNCNDPSRECNHDIVTRVATPDGDIETRRTHTY